MYTCLEGSSSPLFLSQINGSFFLYGGWGQSQVVAWQQESHVVSPRDPGQHKTARHRWGCHQSAPPVSIYSQFTVLAVTLLGLTGTTATQRFQALSDLGCLTGSVTIRAEAAVLFHSSLRGTVFYLSRGEGWTLPHTRGYHLSAASHNRLPSLRQRLIATVFRALAAVGQLSAFGQPRQAASSALALTSRLSSCMLPSKGLIV